MQASFKMRNYKLPGKVETSGFRIAVMAFETSLAGRGALSVEILTSWDDGAVATRGRNGRQKTAMFRRRCSEEGSRTRLDGRELRMSQAFQAWISAKYVLFFRFKYTPPFRLSVFPSSRHWDSSDVLPAALRFTLRYARPLAVKEPRKESNNDAAMLACGVCGSGVLFFWKCGERWPWRVDP